MIKIIKHNDSRFGGMIEVKVHGVSVAVCQCTDTDDVSDRKLRAWARAAHEGMNKVDLELMNLYGGVTRLSQADFAKGVRS